MIGLVPGEQSDAGKPLGAGEESAMTRLALVGSPNSGKTTLFNALTGLRHKVGNYAGVTVEHVEGQSRLGGRDVTIIDLPGTYTLEPMSIDEEVTLRVLRGEMPGCAAPEAVLVVADATTLRRSFGLLAEVLALDMPAALIITMIDELKARKGGIKITKLRRALGIPVFGVVGNKGLGVGDLRADLGKPETWRHEHPELEDTPEARLAWADELVDKYVTEPTVDGDDLTDRIDKVLLHPVWGIAIFLIAMFAFFQVIFAGAAPLQEGLEGLVLSFGELLRGWIPPGEVQSLVVDGVVAGVGGVVVFVPQIALILLMISLLEGSGYMARAAFVIDRVMGWAGLEGRCFVALLSSYACAIPGIMATRSVPDPKSRLATIMVAPFMTCSARLPVYVLLIGAFVPSTSVGGVLSLQGLTFFGLYMLGSVSALLAAALFQRGIMRGRTFPFYMELPPYRLPTVSAVWNQVWRGSKAFLRKAGTIILGASIVLWVLLTYPKVDAPESMAGDETAITAYALEKSAAGQIGKAIEPAIKPLGFDWRIGVGIVSSLAAREVIVSTLAQIYAFSGDEEDLEGLGGQLRAAKDPVTGKPLYTLATALALLVFFVYALQCMSTLAVMRRETNSWKWPVIAFVYMSAVAYGASFITFQVTTLLLS